MARQEHDREDMLAEATALVERASLAVADWGEPVFAGFRRNGAASFYFGPDRAFHFTSQGELRRAYAEGRLLKAERGQLVSLARTRGEHAVELVRREWTTDEANAFLGEMRRDLDRLRQALARGDYRLAGQVPADGDAVGRIQAWLAQFADRIAIARGPRAS